MFEFPQSNALATHIGYDVALTGDQKAAIKAEVENDPAGRGYAGQSTRIQLELFLTSYNSADPTIAPLVKRTGSVPSATLWNELNYLPTTTAGVSVLAALLVASVDPSSPLFGPAIVITKTLGGGMQAIDFDSPTAYARVKAFADGLVQAGVMTQSAANMILCGTSHPSRMDEILGTHGGIVTLAEFEDAIA